MEYDRLIEYKPQLYELHFNKVALLARNGDSQEAIKVFEVAESLNNQDPDL